MQFNKNEIDSIMFDMDGTLWDAMESYVRVWNTAFDELNINAHVTNDDMQSNLGKTLGEIMLNFEKKSGTKFDLPVLTKRIIEIEDEMMPIWGGKPYPNMKDGLAKLSKRYKLFLVSNCGTQGLTTLMNFTGIREYITDIVSHGLRKAPKGDNMLYLKEKHNLKHPIYVGDTHGDAIETHKAGLPFFFARYGFGNTTEFEKAFDSFSELVDYLLAE